MKSSILFRLANNEVLLVGSTPFVPVSGNLLWTFPRFYKEFSLEVEVKLTGKNPDHWTNLLVVTRRNGENTEVGDRFPTISVRPNSYTLRIASGAVNGLLDYVFDRVLPENVWTKVKVEQRLINSKYFYTITIDGVQERNIENTTPYVYDNMKVLVCGAGRCQADIQAMIRNLKITNASPSE